MKLLFRLIGIVLFCNLNVVYAQNTGKLLNDKINGLTKFNDIVNVINEHFENEKHNVYSSAEKDEEFESEETHWRRWEHWNSLALDEKGNLVDSEEKMRVAWEKIETKYKNFSPKGPGSDAKWTFIGPRSENYQGGFYRGHSKIDKIVFHPTDPNRYYVCCLNGGIWKTTDDGATWACITNDLPILSVASMSIDPSDFDHLILISGDFKGGNGIRQNSCGIWNSYDNGFKWYRSSFVGSRQDNINLGAKIMFKPDDANIVLAATSSGIYRSTDGGRNWGNTPILANFVYDIEFKPGSPNTVYLSTNNQLYRSTDGGASFTLSQNINGANRIEIAVSPANVGYVYAICGPYVGGSVVGANQFMGVYRSTDSGVSYSLRANTPNVLSRPTTGIINSTTDNDQSGYDLAIAIDANNVNIIYTGGKTVWRSSNGGTTLTFLTRYVETSASVTPDANYIHPDIQYLAVNPLNNALYACTDGGIYKTTNAGVSWTNLTAGLNTTTFFRIASASFDATKIMGGTQDNGVKYKKDANDFSHITGADGFDADFGTSASGNIFATINSSFMSFDSAGNTISSTTPANTSFFPAVAVSVNNNAKVYLNSGGAGILKSTNSGVSWNVISNLNLTRPRNIATCSSNSNRIYFSGNTNLYRTDDDGVTFSTDLALNTNFPNGNTISDIAVSPINSNRIYATLGGFIENTKVFYSTDAGLNWVNITNSLPMEVKVNAIEVDNANNIYIATDVGVYYMNSGYNAWVPFYNGLPRCPITDIEIVQNSSKIRAGTYGRGIWEASLFTNCDANFTLTGNVSGQKFYQASNILDTDAVIYGGTGTKILTQAGSKIILKPGFRVYGPNYFRARIAPCNSDSIDTPLQKIGSLGIPSFVKELDLGDNSELYRFGVLNILLKDGKPIVQTVIKSSGKFKVIILDEKENILETHELNSSGDVYPKYDFEKEKLYYVVLWRDSLVAHFQELKL